MGRHYKFGLLGSNISYSLSSDIFNHLFKLYGIDGNFAVIDIPLDKLPSEIDRLKKLDGFSVTIPFKEKILEYLDDISDIAGKAGAVNSVAVNDGKLIGYNTDGAGFIYPLKADEITPGKVLVLGCGGAARAVVPALAKKFDRFDIIICGRNIDKAEKLAKYFINGMKDKIHISALGIEEIKENDNYGLIVNATPLGGNDKKHLSMLSDSFRFNSTPVVYDLIYIPAKTLLLRRAEENGCPVINGLAMLVIQAVASFDIWTDRRYQNDIIEMEKAVLEYFLRRQEN